jgi:hypothetical protein
MVVSRQNVTDNRTDISRFMVHLTRDDRGEEHGATARANLENMLAIGEITALRPHCLHAKQIPDAKRHRFAVTCFTETPLSQIKMLTRRIEGRKIKLEPYGFAFKREFLLQRGAAQVIPVNSYADHKALREGFDRMFELAKNSNFSSKITGIIPFLSAMHERYDFSWEREWRVLGSIKFDLDDLQFVILPEGNAIDLHMKLTKQGIPVICPTWGWEKMVERLIRQHRRLRDRLETIVDSR